MQCEFIKIDPYSSTPLYIQLANSVVSALENGELKKDDPLPSINDLSAELEISRDTAEKGYKKLKSMKILASVPGKGYFIATSSYKQRLKIFLLFNKLSAHKKILYDSFLATIGEDSQVDFYIYNNDFKLFKKIISERKEDYTHYVIIPHFIEGLELVPELLKQLPAEKIYLLDKRLPVCDFKYAAIYEDFEDDIYTALESALERLSKYENIKIIFPTHSYYPLEILNGFKNFCQQYAFKYDIISHLREESLTHSTVYITVTEDDLVTLVERLNEAGIKIGEEVGIISYNETPLKRIIMNGITTISTDFKKMGKSMAELVIDNKREEIHVPFFYYFKRFFITMAFVF